MNKTLNINRTFKYILFLFFTILIFLSLMINIENSLRNIGTIKNSDNYKLQKIVNNTTAEAVIVYDAKYKKVLASKNINKRYSLASLTKLVTAVFVYEKDKSLLHDIQNMLKTSSNEDAIRLSKVFSDDAEEQVSYLNIRSEKYNFSFRNVSGLDIILDEYNNRLPGGVSMPMDFINFMKEYYFKYPEIFDQTLVKEENTNLYIDKFSFLSGSKTGFTDLSGGNLFLVIQKGLDRSIFILVLNSTEKNRFVDVQNIANFLLQSSI